MESIRRHDEIKHLLPELLDRFTEHFIREPQDRAAAEVGDSLGVGKKHS
jgi:hypothetical protein